MERLDKKKETIVKAIENKKAFIEALGKDGSIAPLKKAKELDAETSRLLRLEAQLEKVEGEISKLIRTEQLKEQLESIDEVIEGQKQYFIDMIEKYEIYYVAVHDKWTIRRQDGQIEFIKPNALKNYIRELADKDVFEEFFSVVEEMGRKKLNHTFSFDEVEDDLVNLLNVDFLEADMEATENHWLFDVLMTSLGGGKTENIEHIEQVIISKYWNPSNYMLPALVIGGKEGGNGKSLFATAVMRGVFGKLAVADNVAMEKCTGQFNAVLEGKAAVFINESANKRVNEEALKQILHSETLQIERKGMEAVQTSNTALYMISSNDILGAVKLSGTKTDRRFSVINTNHSLERWIYDYDKALGESGIGFKNVTEAKAWLIGNERLILRNPEEIAKWLGVLTRKYGKLQHVECLHGEDYRSVLGIQQPVHEKLFEQIVKDTSYIKRSTFYDLYYHIAKKDQGVAKNKNSFFTEFRSWCDKKGVDLEEKKVRMGGQMPNIFNWSVGTNSSLTCNDDLFFERDGYGNQRWIYEID